MQEIKTILSIYILITICLLTPSMGIYLLNPQYSIIYSSIIIISMPFLALFTIIYQYYRLINNLRVKK